MLIFLRADTQLWKPGEVDYGLPPDVGYNYDHADANDHTHDD